MLYEIAEYLLKHKEGLLVELRKRSFFCGIAGSPFEDVYEQQATVELAHEIAIGLSIHYADVAALLTPELIKSYCGEDFFRKIDCGVS